MEIYDMKLPNGEVVEYTDTNSLDQVEYFAEMGYDLSKIEAFYLAYNDIKNREQAQLVSGYTVSVTGTDAVGLLQVQAAFGLGLTSTVFMFENGTAVPLDANNFAAFAGEFTVARNNILLEKHVNRSNILLPV